MALLTVEERKTRFKFLGLGEYNEENIKKLQKKYLSAKEVDGVYGTHTDNLLRHVYNVKKYTKNFSPEEFKCECGGRYCTGYPSYMKKVELENLQAIRTHWGKPITVTCGLRCSTYNSKLNGSITNSKHLTGYACDFYMPGVTDTLANRKASIKWIKKLPNHNYTYGNGINSYGYSVSAPYMGNALHTDTNAAPASTGTSTSKAAAAATKKAPTTKKTTTKKTTKKPTAQVTLQNKTLAACKKQATWMKNYRYSWESNPTVAKSKKKGTCVTFVACVLQRVGILAKGKYIWHNGKGKVTHANSHMKVMYPKKKLKYLKKTLKPGDVVIAGKPSDVGAGSHIFFVTGKWSGNKPYIWDNHSAERVKKGKSGAHTYSGEKYVIAIVRPLAKKK